MWLSVKWPRGNKSLKTVILQLTYYIYITEVVFPFYYVPAIASGMITSTFRYLILPSHITTFANICIAWDLLRTIRS